MNVALDYRPYLMHRGMGRDLKDLRSVQSVRDLIEMNQRSQHSDDYQKKSDNKVFLPLLCCTGAGGGQG